MTITINPNLVQGVMDAQDKRAALFIVNQRNAELQAAGQPLLAISPNAALKTSYESILVTTVTNAHLSYIAQAATPASLQAQGFTGVELDSINAAISDRLAAGETKADILADIAAL